MVGRTIGKYRIIEQIGRGGMGTVYKAIDDTLDRQVAIKVLNGDVLEPESIERFRREAMTLAKMNHARIGAIHELTRDGHDLLMVMEFLEGESCEKLIERSGPMPVSRAVGICAQVLDALQYAHSAGVVHRDLKPANIMISPSGDIKVMDFGIARVQGSEHLTTHGFMVGTPAYMSPEQVRGEEVDPRMDLYAIAVVFYRLLTNHLPFSGDTAIAMIHSQLTNAPTPARQYRTDLPEWVVAVLNRGLAKNAAERFQSAAEFRAALENGLTGKMPAVTTLASDLEVTVGRMETPMPMLMPPVPAPAPPSQTSPQVPVSAGGTPSSTYLPPAGDTLPAPAPVRPPAKRQETVTLRAPHLATAGLAIVGLVVALGVLAFVVIRRSDTPSPASTPAAGSTTAATPPAPTATPESSTAAPASPPPSSTPTPPAATAPAPARVTPPASTTAATSGTLGATPTGRAADAPRAEPPQRGGPAKESAAPAAADAPAQEFGEMRVVVADGTKGKEVEAVLTLEPGTLVTRNRDKGKDVLRTLPYRGVVAITYVRGRRPKGQRVAGTPEVPENYVGGGVFGGARHWVTLQTSDDFLILRLEDRNVITAMAALEARTGVKIQRQSD